MREINRHGANEDRPDTPINVPKVAKKSFIAWLVPALCVAVIMGLVTIARSWADDRYTQKTDYAAGVVATTQAIQNEEKKREALETTQEEMNRKLDLIIYILNREGKVGPSDMRGKLTTPP